MHLSVYYCRETFFAKFLTGHLVKFVILTSGVVRTWSFLDRKLGKATAATILSSPLMPTHKLPSLYTTKPLKSFTMVCQCKLSIRHALHIPFLLFIIKKTLQAQPLPVYWRAASWEMTSKLGFYCVLLTDTCRRTALCSQRRCISNAASANSSVCPLITSTYQNGQMRR